MYSKFSDEDIIKSIKKYIAGSSIEEAAKEINASQISVLTWLKKAGIALRPNPNIHDWKLIKESL